MQPPAGFRGVFRSDEMARALYAEGAGIFRIIPAAVAVPEDVADLATLARWASGSGTPLVPRGAGSGMPGGNVGAGVVVDLTRGFRRGPLVDVDARIARAGAAVTWHAVDEAAASTGLFLPPDPSSGRFCTIGGMCATNAAGARSLKYGAMSDWVEAIEFVTADGETGRAGGLADRRAEKTAAEKRFERDAAPFIAQHRRAIEAAVPRTRKNSSGYRLTGRSGADPVRDLLIGSEGTLAFITGVELRLAPRPAREFTLLVPVAALAELPEVVASFEQARPVAIELIDRTFLEFAGVDDPRIPAASEAVLLVTLDEDAIPALGPLGTRRGVFMTEDPEQSRELWRIRHRASPVLAGLPDHQRSLQVVEDGCVPPARLGEYVAGLRNITRSCGFDVVIFGHAGDGHLHANILADVRAPDLAGRLERCLEETSALQIALKGTTSGEHGDGRLRAPFVEPLFGAISTEAYRKVKQAFDPKGIMNPGVKLDGRWLMADGKGGTAIIVAEQLKVGPGAPAIPAEVERTLRRIEKEAQWDVDRLSLLPAPESAAV